MEIKSMVFDEIYFDHPFISAASMFNIIHLQFQYYFA